MRFENAYFRRTENRLKRDEATRPWHVIGHFDDMCTDEGTGIGGL